jgi:adenine-specific DNA-methyltransferase
MNYIGSKHKLFDFIRQSVYAVVGTELSSLVFCDLFAGTGVVGRNFKNEVKQIISNDLEYYSYVLNRNYISNNEFFDFQHWIDRLNQIPGVEGFIFNEYTADGPAQRNYFSTTNGKKIDAIRLAIRNWKEQGKISENQYYFLLASLLESADQVANTASVYSAYLKRLKKSAQKELIIKPALYERSAAKHQVYNQDSNLLIKKIEGDILYIDPPYNVRQYGSNYHLLNTIALYDQFIPQGKTGLRTYNRSRYSHKTTVLATFENLIANARFKYLFLSYNNEGLMRVQDIQQIMSKYGTYQVFTRQYRRFKADSEENRSHKATRTVEYLHVLEKH